VNILEDVEGKLAEELVQKCPANVFDIEDMGSGICLFYRFTGNPTSCGHNFWYFISLALTLFKHL
jgi:hypothetical protein